MDKVTIVALSIKKIKEIHSFSDKKVYDSKIKQELKCNKVRTKKISCGHDYR